MIRVEFEEHSFGMIEGQVYHSGEYAEKNMTAREVFQIARDIAFYDSSLGAKEKKAKMDKIDRLERIAKKYGYMHIWYMMDWGRQLGGHCFQKDIQTSFREKEE
jgi:hypothetical protein